MIMTKQIIGRIALVLAAATLTSFGASTQKAKVEYPAVGSVESLDPQFNQLVAPGAKIEKLAEGFKWSEGPVWISAGRFLLFSDIPNNVVLRWKEGEGIKTFLTKSGYTGAVPRGGELGANGLLLDNSRRLVLCEHGDRRMARLEMSLGKIIPAEKNTPVVKTTLAEYYLHRRFNSPNDAVYRSNGDLYFTDPPYGLELQDKDPNRELLFSGVYRVPRNGEIQLLTSELKYPNGIAFSPDEKTLYVANSDPARPIWVAFDVLRNGGITNGHVFFDATALAKDAKGLPDGMKVDRKGNIFASGPGGVLVFSPVGKHLGTIHTGEVTANCAWGDDGSVLYMTCNMTLCRVKTLTRGKGF
jgi:gluconolactonase